MSARSDNIVNEMIKYDRHDLKSRLNQLSTNLDKRRNAWGMGRRMRERRKWKNYLVEMNRKKDENQV